MLSLSFGHEANLVIANSSLPAVQQAVRNRRVGTDSRADRMTIWLQNVESTSSIWHAWQIHLSHAAEVVADARQNFGSSNISLLPPLPVAPGPQTRRPSRERSNENSYNSSTRPSRKAVASNQVFHLEEDSSADQSGLSLATSTLNDSQMALSDATPAVQPDGPTRSCLFV
jgi:serine/threonine-protein kinase GIN4